MMLTTQFFAMKTQRYMHDYGITESTLAQVAAKNFRNGARNPNAWRQKAWDEEEILASRMLNRAAAPVHVLLAGGGRRRRRRVPRRPGAAVHGAAGVRRTR